VLCAVELNASDRRVILDPDEDSAITAIGESSGSLQDLLDGVRDFEGHASFELNLWSFPKPRTHSSGVLVPQCGRTNASAATWTMLKEGFYEQSASGCVFDFD
jgi:hypothetical protein